MSYTGDDLLYIRLPGPPVHGTPDNPGLLWIENQLPFSLTIRPNPAVRRQMPPTLLPST